MIFFPHPCINYRVFFLGEQAVFDHISENTHCHLIHDFILFHARFPPCIDWKYNICGSSIFCFCRNNQKILFRSLNKQI